MATWARRLTSQGAAVAEFACYGARTHTAKLASRNNSPYTTCPLQNLRDCASLSGFETWRGLVQHVLIQACVCTMRSRLKSPVTWKSSWCLDQCSSPTMLLASSASSDRRIGNALQALRDARDGFARRGGGGAHTKDRHAGRPLASSSTGSGLHLAALGVRPHWPLPASCLGPRPPQQACNMCGSEAKIQDFVTFKLL